MALKDVVNLMATRSQERMQHDLLIVEGACDLSKNDPQERGVVIERETGKVYLSITVPQGQINDVYPVDTVPTELPALWMMA